ncbi:MAG TPA: hypothetical protein VMG30_11340 [Acidobacteriota bacterium]|nr:hypothetical protein [Acidobacteriota bacterium]
MKDECIIQWVNTEFMYVPENDSTTDGSELSDLFGVPHHAAALAKGNAFLFQACTPPDPGLHLLLSCRPNPRLSPERLTCDSPRFLQAASILFHIFSASPRRLASSLRLAAGCLKEGSMPRRFWMRINVLISTEAAGHLRLFA